MGAIDWIAARLGYAPRRRSSAPGYAAAQISRLTASLTAETDFINNRLRYQLRILRARSRQVAQNNPYARRFFQMVVDNVGGPQPFRLQAKVRFNKGTFDDKANEAIETAWRDWSRKGVPDLSETWSWNALQRLCIRSLAVDGEMLLRVYRGPEYGRHGIRVQLIDIDRLDDWKNKALSGGGAIHMGVEVDAVGRRVAYHILKRRPADWQLGYAPRESDRVPADEIIHVFVPEFAEQVRGVPWIYAALLNLVNLGAGEEAAVIAFRIGAAHMGFIESPDGGATLAEAGVDGHDAQGRPQIEAEPGSFPLLPPGYKFNGEYNPKYPDAAYGPFIDACLHGIAAGVGVAHHNLSGNMRGVNYSSARVAELDENDGWMALQNFVIEHLHDPFFSQQWLPMQVLTGVLPFDFARMDKYRTVHWQGRRWAWVDPEKEVNAAIAAIDHRLKSRTRLIAEGGEDIEDVFTEIAAEEQLAKDKNVTLPPIGASKPAAQSKPDNGDPDDGQDAE